MATKKTTKTVTEQEELIVAEEPMATESPVVEEVPVTEENPVPTRVVQAGKVESMMKVSTGSCADYNVRFPQPFDAGTEPDVVVGFLTSSTAARFGNCACGVLEGSVNNEGFTIRFFNGDTSGRIPHFSWIAFGTVTQ